MYIEELNIGKMVLPDFEAWERNGISSEWLDGKVAPEDLWIELDGDRFEYFTARAIRLFEENVLIPNGWRLPTPDEWHKMVEEFGTEAGESDHRILMANLGLRYGGYVEEDVMDDYNDNPSDSGYIHNLGSAGYYLASNLDDNCADCASEIARYFYYLKKRDAVYNFEYMGTGAARTHEGCLVRCVTI